MLIQRVEEMFPAFKLWMSNSPQYFPLEECDILLKLEVKKNDENFGALFPLLIHGGYDLSLNFLPQTVHQQQLLASSHLRFHRLHFLCACFDYSSQQTFP